MTQQKSKFKYGFFVRSDDRGNTHVSYPGRGGNTSFFKLMKEIHEARPDLLFCFNVESSIYRSVEKGDGASHFMDKLEEFFSACLKYDRDEKIYIERWAEESLRFDEILEKYTCNEEQGKEKDE